MSRAILQCSLLLVMSACSLYAVDPASIMPREEDRTSMWWAEGFPSHSPAAPWHRCVQTGYYGFVLDTESLRIPHFGPIEDEPTLSRLPAAQLALRILVDGKAYDCSAGGKWSKYGGPRLIESGRFFQRADVTDLVFAAEDGRELNVEARLETAAWPDRLGLILAARPGIKSIEAGEASFGRIGGGYGLDGTNHLEVEHRAELDTEKFTLELWCFVPSDYRASKKTLPWLVCKNRNEEADGNYGITINNGRTQARMNIGGGRQNAFTAIADRRNALKVNAWNHLAMTYDGALLRIYVNGRESAAQVIGRKRASGTHPLTFGRRQDNVGDGYYFRGVIDEAAYYDRALNGVEIRERFQRPDIASDSVKPVEEWKFREDGEASMTAPREGWKLDSLSIELRGATGSMRQSSDFPSHDAEDDSKWHEVSLAINPSAFPAAYGQSEVTVRAAEIPNGIARPIEYDSARSWHRINLDGIEPIVLEPANENRDDNRNNAMERIKLVLSNPSGRDQTARLMFEKTSRGFRHRIGSAITGVSAILRDANGHPTGIPVQLSKNWHNDAEAGTYSGQWFHGITQIRLPPESNVELELSIVYGHWGGVAAASHAQLCLIGWGSNQLWNQSALGAWGESICYEPDQVQANCSITDVRPLMVRGMASGQAWRWTCNVGGGDYFRLFDKDNERVPHATMKTTYHRYGPCLTEVTHAGRLGKSIDHAATVSLARTNDLVRGTYRLRTNVSEVTDFSRFVILQIGADTYSYTGERKMAIGDETGLHKEWSTQWGGDTYRTEPILCTGRVPWASLHDAAPRLKQGERGAWANRGVVIRTWNARLGGKVASPWIAERGTSARGSDSSTLDIVPPPGVTRLEPGDFVEATIEFIVMPQFASDYYGPSEALRTALKQHENTWNMIHREAVGNDRRIETTVGEIERLYPDVCIRTQNDEAEFTLTGGLSYVPITFGGLTSPHGYKLFVNDLPFDQSVHGNDFWQTDYDPVTKRWSQTYNLPATTDQPQKIQFRFRNHINK